jgi:hypothetical protein
VTRVLVVALLFFVFFTATVQGAPTVAVAKKPNLSCPQTELGDADLQARYATIWERYSVAVDEATKKVRGEIEKQTKSATATGNLDLALFWKTTGKEFEQKGELRWDEPTLKKTWGDRFGDASFPADFSVAVKRASDAYASARKNLEKGYGELVAEFTKAEKLEEALKVRGEIKELLAEKASAQEPPPPPAPDKPKPEPKPVVNAPKNGKYRFVFSDGSGGGLLLELQDEILWIHGDINPKKLNGIFVWPNPRPVPCRVVGGKVLTDDGDPASNKWRCAITWDTKSGEVSYLYDNFKGTKLQRQGKITASSW